MRDAYEDQIQRHGREQTNRLIDGIIAHIMQSFRVLHRVHYSAPWRTENDLSRRFL